MMQPFTVTVTVFDIDFAQSGRLPSAPTPFPIDWTPDRILRQAVGEFEIRSDDRAGAQVLIEATAQALNARVLAGSKPIAFVAHSVGRFGGHWGWSFVPAGYCRGCGQTLKGAGAEGGALDDDGYHVWCRPLPRGAAKAIADARVLGLR